MGMEDIGRIFESYSGKSYASRTAEKVVMTACKRILDIWDVAIKWTPANSTGSVVPMCNIFVRDCLIEAGYNKSLSTNTGTFFPWWTKNLNVVKNNDDLKDIPKGNIVGFFRDSENTAYPGLAHVMINIESRGSVVGTNNGCFKRSLIDHFLLSDFFEKIKDSDHYERDKIFAGKIENVLFYPKNDDNRNRCYICHVRPEDLPGA